MVAAHLTAIGEGDRLAGLTLMVTVLDQYHGRRGRGRDRRGNRRYRHREVGAGVLDGQSLAEVFAWLRPTDLVWRYWVNNYIEGKSPAPFDVLYWNADTTRMAAALHREMCRWDCRTRSSNPGRCSMLGTPVDLGR